MYFPYLRSKQYELIALRELADSERIPEPHKQLLSPIIEPVKISPQLSSTLVSLRNHNINFNVILNPQHGTLQSGCSDIVKIVLEVLGEYSNFQWGMIIDEDLSLSDIQSMLECVANANSSNLLLERDNKEEIVLLHNEARNDISELLTNLSSVRFNVIYSQRTTKRYFRNFPSDSRVSLDDFFNLQPRNADYLAIEDSPFSEEHLYYQEEGYVGFGDFLTIGDSYSEGGFQPYAVAIHFSYVDNNKIRVRHFVSDDNYNSGDVPRKFLEALSKMMTWVDKNKPAETLALSQFKELYQREHFPGLGSVKKLSIMNHIELVLGLIEA